MTRAYRPNGHPLKIVKANVYSKCQFYNQITTRSTQIRRKDKFLVFTIDRNRGTHSRKIPVFNWGALSLFRVLCILRSIHMKNILLIVEV
ncbi:hypothetical protein Plhal703r1_c71g0171481 [Plasmopara halstedii]